MAGPLQDGTLFSGRYRIVRCIAAGGMGAVYEAVHVGTERRRALKVMHSHLFENDEMRERFAREARITSAIESEYIVDVTDAGVDEATRMPFLVMEFLRGEELGQRLKRVGRFSPTEVVTYLNQAAMALDKTHQAAIIHRDLKPANVFLTAREDGSPRVKILDFGVAKVMSQGATAAATQSFGTPLYMPPEQFRVGTKSSPAADIYALGMMAYTMLVGEAYWSDEAKNSGDVIAFAVASIGGPVESAVKRAAARQVTLPASFDPWFKKVTAVNPADRFPTATGAIRALAEALGVSGVTAPLDRLSFPTFDPALGAPLSTRGGSTSVSAGMAVTAARRSPNRGALMVIALGMVVGSVVAGGIVTVWLGRGKQAPLAVRALQPSAAMAAAMASVNPTEGASSAAALGASAATAMPAPAGDPEHPIDLDAVGDPVDPSKVPASASASASASATGKAAKGRSPRPPVHGVGGKNPPAPSSTSLFSRD